MTESLPTFSQLGMEIPTGISAQEVAASWLASFANVIATQDLPGILDLFLKDGWWRDMLALTWEMRTFKGAQRIQAFLKARLELSKLSMLQLSKTVPPKLESPYPDLGWVLAFFDFETDVGKCIGVVRLVAVPGSLWKAFTMFTNLEGLKGFEEEIGSNRNYLPNHGKWLDTRRREMEFENAEPTVLIIGAGQSGLGVAARLKALSVPALIIERNERVGDQWRHRYQSLCLHDQVWNVPLPYMPFPASWPVYAPGHKFADWLEAYAHALELNVWTSSTIKSSTWNAQNKHWTVTVTRSDGSERELKPRHIVYAAGIADRTANIPQIAGMDDFQGNILPSNVFNTAADYIGKKVVVVGSASAAHDIAQDFCNHGVDVTMYQRSSTYVMSTKNGMAMYNKGLYCEGGPSVDVADRIRASEPTEVMKFRLARLTKEIADLDKETLTGLKRVGFNLNDGIEGSGFLYLQYVRGGGYYLDVGASQLIIDGKIKLKHGEVERFTASGIKFTDGSDLPADVVIFATGFGDPTVNLLKLFPIDVLSCLKPVWSLDEEGEERGVWRDSGHEHFWFIIGSLELCRFHSKHIALQIKAIEEGLFGTRYTV